MPGQTKYLPLGAQSVAYSFVQSTLCKKTGLYFLKCSSTIYMAVHLMCKACVCVHQLFTSRPFNFVLCAETLACDLRSDETLLYLGV